MFYYFTTNPNHTADDSMSVNVNSTVFFNSWQANHTTEIHTINEYRLLKKGTMWKFDQLSNA